MDRFDRVFELHRILATRRRPVSRRELEEKMGCSRATVMRAIDFLRDQLLAPLEYDRERNGYYYRQDDDGPWQLPGLWFSSEELHALMSSYELLSRVQPGIFEDALRPAMARIEQLLRERRAGARDLVDRVRILQMGPRPVDVHRFRQVAASLAGRRRLHVFYRGRARDELSERSISPQRLVYYRDNWYVDAWCHWRQDLRTFSLDRLHIVDTLPEAAVDVSDEDLNNVLSSAYGIFAGAPCATAVLHFTPRAARWVADEQWHPQQQSRILDDGGIELSVPYADPRELTQDVLRFGPEVEVIGPPDLRGAIRESLAQALQRYE